MSDFNSALVDDLNSSSAFTGDVETDDNNEDDAGGDVPRFTQISLVRTVVLFVMFLISLIANVATLVRMYRMRRRRSTINFLIVQLATADLLVTFFCNVTDAVWSSVIQWYAGNAMCKGVKFLQVGIKCSSISFNKLSLFYVNIASSRILASIQRRVAVNRWRSKCLIEQIIAI